MSRKVIIPATGLVAGRVYSPGIQAGNMLFVSGHTGSDPVTREIRDGIQEQTRQALENIRGVLAAANASLADVAKITIYMVDMQRDFAPMNEVFKGFFPSEPPARCTVGVSHLARPGLLLEIEAVAVLAG